MQQIPAEKVATTNLVTITLHVAIWEAFELMLKNKIRRLPVVDGDKLVGIVTERDLFKWIVKVIYEPNLPPHIAKLIAQS